MGNCWAVVRPSEGSCMRAVNAKPDQKALQVVVKMDGKILEFRAPLLVKDVLLKFSGSGIGLSKTVTQHLPLNYELKMGKVYYILPYSVDPDGAPTPESNSSMAYNTQQTGGVKRIKVVVTKQELQQLLTKQISVEEFLQGLRKEVVFCCISQKLEAKAGIHIGIKRVIVNRVTRFSDASLSFEKRMNNDFMISSLVVRLCLTETQKYKN